MSLLLILAQIKDTLERRYDFKLIYRLEGKLRPEAGVPFDPVGDLPGDIRIQIEVDIASRLVRNIMRLYAIPEYFTDDVQRINPRAVVFSETVIPFFGLTVAYILSNYTVRIGEYVLCQTE